MYHISKLILNPEAQQFEIPTNGHNLSETIWNPDIFVQFFEFLGHGVWISDTKLSPIQMVLLFESPGIWILTECCDNFWNDS